MKPNDLYTMITTNILRLMRTHGSDWTRPWTGPGMHRNIITNTNYRGINVLLLGLSASEHGYDKPIWGTFRQWKVAGGSVRKNEKGTLGVFYKPLTVDKDGKERNIPVLKHFYLFNIEQVDGIEVNTIETFKEPVRIGAAEDFINSTGAIIHQGGSKAVYSPTRDYIRIPLMSAFGEPEAYYSTLLHELSHWTGHQARLNRRKGMQSRFGDQTYAMEELVAELGSAFLSIMMGVIHEPRADHAKYLNNWMEVLGNDMRAFSTAASRAQKAADYLFGLQDKVVEAA